MKFFLDTEFIERGPDFPVKLISIGIVCEDGREFYAVADWWDESEASDWVRQNVIAHLGDHRRQNRQSMQHAILAFVTAQPEKPEFWGYYADYDWVVFCQIFGTMMDLPKGWPMYCRDLKQLCDSLGNPALPKQTSTEHNALADAKWNQLAYNFLQQVNP